MMRLALGLMLACVAAPVVAATPGDPGVAERKEGLADAARSADVEAVWSREPILGKGLSLYRANYFMPLTWSDEAQTGGDAEAQFQISFKQRIGQSHVFVAYTQTSFWRIWDNDDSRPFRETNFMPEAFYRLRAKKNPLGAFDIDIGIEHQSNGRSQPDSRSWNRVYLRPIFRTRDWRVQVKLFERVFDKDRRSTIDDPDGDDNPRIVDFMGHHELLIDWNFSGQRRLSWMSRLNFNEEKGALRLRYTEPTTVDGFYWFVQVFHGYGESLIDFDREVSRVGIGIAISR